jgi:DNA-binding winged helix-turn-helix (wHTH) protein
MENEFKVTRTVFIERDGYRLSNFQSDIFIHFLENEGKFIPREDILKAIYGDKIYEEKHQCFKAQLCIIRKFLLKSKSNYLIETVTGKSEGRRASASLGWRLKKVS